MRIRTIELAWFRGAAGAIALEPNGKSMVVYGENGSGKSSFVDAVEYVLNNGSNRASQDRVQWFAASECDSKYP